MVFTRTTQLQKARLAEPFYGYTKPNHINFLFNVLLADSLTFSKSFSKSFFFFLEEHFTIVFLDNRKYINKHKYYKKKQCNNTI